MLDISCKSRMGMEFSKEKETIVTTKTVTIEVNRGL